MSYVLPREKQIQVLHLLVEGSSLRSITRLTGVHRTTVMNLLVEFGKRCRTFLDGTLRNLDCRHLELDEIWTYVQKKQGQLTQTEQGNPTIGDQYLFIAQDQDSKLIVTYTLGKRNGEVTQAFIDDLAGRINVPFNPNEPWSAKPQISTDGWQSYPTAIYAAFGSCVNYGQLIKSYANDEQPGRYGPPTMVEADRRRVTGVENLGTICTSHVERNNASIRLFIKRFSRLTFAFSKKLENLAAAIALHVAYFNFCWRMRENEGGRLRLTPAMQAGVVNTLWTIDDLYDAVMVGA
jgi:IS1 family transposase